MWPEHWVPPTSPTPNQTVILHFVETPQLWFENRKPQKTHAPTYTSTWLVLLCFASRPPEGPGGFFSIGKSADLPLLCSVLRLNHRRRCLCNQQCVPLIVPLLNLNTRNRSVCYCFVWKQNGGNGVRFRCSHCCFHSVCRLICESEGWKNTTKKILMSVFEFKYLQ